MTGTERQGCIVVTGAGGGIGAATARALARKGRDLILSDRDTASLERTLAHCAREASSVLAMAADVTCEQDIAAIVGTAVERPNGLTGFVAAAGVAGVVRPVSDYPVDAFREALEINTVGTFLCLRRALPAMRNAGGSFVALGSTSSIRGRAGLAGYVASKHAVLGLVRSSALECVGSSVRVNAVLPGPVQTAMIEAIDEMVANQAPTGEGRIKRAVEAPIGLPDDVAQTILFLLSNASRHMNGAAVVLDGGSTLA